MGLLHQAHCKPCHLLDLLFLLLYTFYISGQQARVGLLHQAHCAAGGARVGLCWRCCGGAAAAGPGQRWLDGPNNVQVREPRVLNIPRGRMELKPAGGEAAAAAADRLFTCLVASCGHAVPAPIIKPRQHTPQVTPATAADFHSLVLCSFMPQLPCLSSKSMNCRFHSRWEQVPESSLRAK